MTIEVTNQEKVASLVPGAAPSDIRPDWILNVQSMIEEYLGEPFTDETTYDEMVDGANNEYIFLKHRPVLSVTSVQVYGQDVPQATYKLYAEAGYIRLIASRLSDFDYRPLPYVPGGPQTCRVVYSAAFQVTGRIELCATMMVATIAQAARQGLLGTGGFSYRVGNVNVQNQKPAVVHEELQTLMEKMLPRRNASFLGGSKPARALVW